MTLIDTSEQLQSALTFWASDEAAAGTYLLRCHMPKRLCQKGVGGAVVATARDGWLLDMSSAFATVSDALESSDVVDVARNADLPRIGTMEEVLHQSVYAARRLDNPHLLSPVDWHVIKACGVTFLQSLIERLIEEQVDGDQSRAASAREGVMSSIGTQLKSVTPGSDSAERLKKELQDVGVWSQYLEVAIGRHAEVFTKGPVLSSVGFGQQVGIRRDSEWNNPEPELALVMNSHNEIVGATLGNDVNLRDFEGRSALLLGEAKDFEASCSLGPAVRLFDDSSEFSLEELMSSSVHLGVQGEDGFELSATSDLSTMTRDPRDLVQQAGRDSRTYPDGYVLLTGTMFAPTVDRLEEGMGFTHRKGDFVSIENEFLGSLINWVNFSDEVPRWTTGARAFSGSLFARGLI